MVAPVRDHVVVYGWPQDEGNTVELVDRLGSRDVAVRWLLDGAPGNDVASVLGDVAVGATETSAVGARVQRHS